MANEIRHPETPTRETLVHHPQIVALTELTSKLDSCGIEMKMIGETKTYWLKQEHKLPFKVDRDFWDDPDGVAGWEVLVLPAERGTLMSDNNQRIFILMVEMLSVEKPRKVQRQREHAFADWSTVGDDLYNDPRSP